MHPVLQVLTHLIIGIIITIITDSFWFTLTMKHFYEPQLRIFLTHHHHLIQKNLVWAVLAWTTMTIGNYFFVLPQGNNKIVPTLFWGMAYGVIIYFVYNASNKGIFSSWPLYIVIIDSLWGACLNGFVSTILLFIKQYI